MPWRDRARRLGNRPRARDRDERLPLPDPARLRFDLVRGQAPSTPLPVLARPLYWFQAERRQMLAAALEAGPDLVLAGERLTLPVDAALKRRLGALLVCDSHE